MRTLHIGLRVTDLERAIGFYTAVGYGIIGSVPESGQGHLTMLKLPGDEFVTIELVHNPGEPAVEGRSNLNHIVIHVDSMDVTLAELADQGIDAEVPRSPDGSADFLTTWIVDPDGNRIELVQWPDGHADGMSSADWAN
ncbi:VOC family protein [Sporichthya sp.]|uniref:VOC family protein n=1 Tax=Sporichthya sp. TaxID=65475 RepID=UPI0018189589|nr:VOC family protein [Sporichthya sp.]MBA3741584.1 VOC family protein [Sporichthya sp.]